MKLWDNCEQEFGGVCRRGALAGGKRVFEDLNTKKSIWRFKSENEQSWLDLNLQMAASISLLFSLFLAFFLAVFLA